MKTIADLKSQSGISMPQESITFIGPPDFLEGHIVFENKSKADFHIADLLLEHKKIKELSEVQFDNFQVNSDLKAGQRLLQRVRISLDPAIPPSSHEMEVMIGGIRKKIKLIIQPNISIEINPGEINFPGISPGLTHSAVIRIINKGNIPVTLPAGRSKSELSEKNISKCLIDAISESSGKQTLETLDTFFSKIRQELEDGVKISFEEPGMSLNPGQSCDLHVNLTLPDVIKEEQYSGVIRIFNDKISYKIINISPEKPIRKSPKKK